MPCTTHVISFYYGKSHRNDPKKDRYHDAVNHTCDNTSLVKCLQTFAPIKVQSHNAVNDTRYLILFWEYPTQTFKKNSVPWCRVWHMLLQFIMKNPTSMAQKSSVPWCRVRHMLLHFSMENPTYMAQKRSVPWCCKSHMWQYFTSEINVCKRLHKKGPIP